MTAQVDAAVQAAVSQGERVRVIVTFDHPPTTSELTGYDVVFVIASINAAVFTLDSDCLDRLLRDPTVVRIEADGEIHALD